MNKKYYDVRINSIERNMEENTISYLQYILNTSNEDEILKRLKYTGYFVTDRVKEIFEKSKKRLVKKWVKKFCSKSNYKKFCRYEYEGKILDKKKKNIEKKIKGILEYFYKKRISSSQILEKFNAIIFHNYSYKGLYETLNEQLLAANENIILGLGNLIRWGLLKDGLKGENPVLNEDMNNIIKVIQIYGMINDLIKNWMFGEVTIKKGFFEKIYISENFGIISDRIVSFEEYSSLNKVKLIKNAFINEDYKMIYENSLREKVKEFFYTDTFEEKYIDISLDTWIKVYVFFYELVSDTDVILKISNLALKKALEANGIEDSEIPIILENLTFGKNNTDLFSSFLIECDNEFLILTSLFKASEPLKSMMLLFTKNPNGKINQKGKAFENHVVKMFDGFKSVQNIKTTHKGESYELDVLLFLDNTLFVFECKVQFQHEDVRGYCRNIQELDYYIAKFKRNLDYFFNEESGRLSIDSRLKRYNSSFDINKVKVIPIFLSNISYPFTQKNDIYILDEVKLYNFFNSQSPHIHFVDNENEKIYIIDQLSSELFRTIDKTAFIKFLNQNKNYEIDPRGAIRILEVNYPEYGIYAERCTYDADLFQKNVKVYVRQRDKK